MCWFGAEVKGGAVGKVEFVAQGQHILFSLLASWCFHFALPFAKCMQQVRKVLITRAEEVGNTLSDDLIGRWLLKGTEAEVATGKIFRVG